MAPPPSKFLRNVGLAVVGALALYVAYGKVTGSAATTTAGSEPPSDHGSHVRTIGPDLADTLGKIRLKRTGQIDWDADQQGGVVISGKVIELGTHVGVADVEVVFRSPQGEETTTAGVDGAYSIRMPPGIYRAFVRDDEILSIGYRDRDAERVPGGPAADTAGVPDEALMSVVMANRDVAGLDLTVVHGGTITGTVVDGAGHAIANAVVSSDSAARTALGSDIAETDDKGRFEIHVPPGYVSLLATHPRYAGIDPELRQSLEITAGSKSDVTLTMVVGCVISGRVVTTDNKPAGDGAMETQNENGQSYGPTGRIEPDGSFRWVTQTEEKVALRAWPWKSSPSETKQFECKPGVRFHDVVFHVPNGAPDIAGTLVDREGQPVPFTYIDLQPLDGGIAQQERTDAEGNWGVYAMPHGRYHLTAASSERGIVSMDVASPQTGIVATMSGVGRVEGTTTSLADGSFSFVLVNCIDGGAVIPLAHMPRTVSVTAGHFEIDNVPACNLQYQATWQQQRKGAAIVVPVDGIARIEVDLGPPRPKTVHGVVTRDGQPVANAEIKSYAENDEEATARTGADGRYSIKSYSRASISVYIDQEYVEGGRVGGANIPDEERDFELGSSGDRGGDDGGGGGGGGDGGGDGDGDGDGDGVDDYGDENTIIEDD